jgi:hypothetical protein
MKRDMVELKKLVADIIEHGGVSTNFQNIRKRLTQLYRDIELPSVNNHETQFTLQQPVNNNVNSNNTDYNITHEAEEVEESLSLSIKSLT